MVVPVGQPCHDDGRSPVTRAARRPPPTWATLHRTPGPRLSTHRGEASAHTRAPLQYISRQRLRHCQGVRQPLGPCSSTHLGDASAPTQTDQQALPAGHHTQQRTHGGYAIQGRRLRIMTVPTLRRRTVLGKHPPSVGRAKDRSTSLLLGRLGVDSDAHPNYPHCVTEPDRGFVGPPFVHLHSFWRKLHRNTTVIPG